MEKIQIVAEELPELDTEVAVAGPAHQQEVGGAVCFGIIAGVIIGA